MNIVLQNGQSYSAPIVLGAGWLILVVAVVLLGSWGYQLARRQFHWGRALLQLLFYSYLVLLLQVTLFPIGIFPPGHPVYHNGWGQHLLINWQLAPVLHYSPLQIGGNLLLLLPLGLLAALLTPSYRTWRTNLCLAFFTSLGIEVLQLVLNYLYMGNRIFDVNDLWLNTAGGLAGFAIYLVLRRMRGLRNSSRQ